MNIDRLDESDSPVHPQPAASLIQLQAAHPTWTIWRSRTGALWCATRRRELADPEWYGRSWMTLIEEDASALARQLKKQQAEETPC